MRSPLLWSRIALACGAIGLLLGRSGFSQAPPPVTIRTPGLPEPGNDVTLAERVADWSNYQRSGWQKMDRGWYDSAEREFLGAIRAARRTSADVRTRLLAQSYAGLAWALLQQGKAAEADPLARWVLDIWLAEHGAASPITARAINLVATIDFDLGKRPDAEALLRPMLALDSAASIPLQQEQAQGGSLLGLILATGHDYTHAEVEYARAIARREALRTRDDEALGDDWNNLAWCRIEQRKLAEARTAMNRALSLLEARRGAGDPTVARALDGLVRIDIEQGDLGAAESKLLRSIGIAEAGGPTRLPQLRDALRRYAALLDRMNRPRDAEATRAKLARLGAPAPASPAASAGSAAPPASASPGPALTPPHVPRAPSPVTRG